MKPNKRNLIYCPAYGGCKLQFDSKAKADRFLSYNHDEILSAEGKAPVRSYYCSTCCKWHVTSRQKNTHVDSVGRSKSLRLKKLIDDISRLMQRGDLQMAQSQLKHASSLFDNMHNNNRELASKISQLLYFNELLNDVIKLDDSQRKEFFKDDSNDIIQRLETVYHNYKLSSFFTDKEKEMSQYAAKGNIKALSATFNKVALTEFDFKGPMKDGLKHEYTLRLELLRRLYNPLFKKLLIA